MGRKEDEVDSDFSKFLYPSLQVTDILSQRYEVCLGGMDQRRAHVLAREMLKKLELDWNPVAIHTPLLPGLSGAGRMDVLAVSEEEVYDRMIEGKMSKSKPGDATFIHDSEEEIKTKIMNAFCPQKVIVDNPIIAINQHVLFPEEGFELFIPRPQKYGGDLVLSSYEVLVTKFRSGDLHPQDLKAATAKALINLLEPVRTYFAKHEEATRYKDRVAGMVVTRWDQSASVTNPDSLSVTNSFTVLPKLVAPFTKMLLILSTRYKNILTRFNESLILYYKNFPLEGFFWLIGIRFKFFLDFLC